MNSINYKTVVDFFTFLENEPHTEPPDAVLVSEAYHDMVPNAKTEFGRVEIVHTVLGQEYRIAPNLKFDSLYLDGTNITYIPENTIVKDTLSIVASDITHIDKNCQFGIIHANDSNLEFIHPSTLAETIDINDSPFFYSVVKELVAADELPTDILDYYDNITREEDKIISDYLHEKYPHVQRWLYYN